MAVTVTYEGLCCGDCACVIANDDWSGIDDAEAHEARIGAENPTASGRLHVVMACDHESSDCDEFRTARCDYCGWHGGARFHAIAFLSDDTVPEEGGLL